jgi:hypothetical protein
MLFYLCETSKSKGIAPLHIFHPPVYLSSRMRVWCSGRVSECNPVDLASRPGDVAFETIQFCRRSSTFVKVCRKSSTFIVILSSGMPESFSDTRLNWSCVTRCGCRTTSSTFFTVHFLLYINPSSYKTLQPIPSELPYIWGKFWLIFCQRKELYLVECKLCPVCDKTCRTSPHLADRLWACRNTIFCTENIFGQTTSFKKNLPFPRILLQRESGRVHFCVYDPDPCICKWQRIVIF